MSKTIEIKKVHFRNLFLAFILGFSSIYGLEHFGKFSFIADTSNTQIYYKNAFEGYGSSDTKIQYIYFDTFFNNKVTTSGNGFNVGDLTYSDSDFKKYSVKSYYYTQATLKDFKFALLFSVIFFVVFWFFNNFKIKLS